MPTIDLPFSADAYMDSQYPTTNGGYATWNGIGKYGTQQYRSLFRINFSSMPAKATITGATVYFTVSAVGNAGTLTFWVYRLLKMFNEGQETWRIYQTGSGWAAYGMQSGTDYNATLLATVVTSANAVGNVVSWAIDATTVQYWYDGTWTNNGFCCIGDNTITQKQYASMHHGTPSYKPFVRVTYTLPPSGFFLFF